MRKTSKFIALLMAMLMVFALGFTACGSKTEEAADDGQNPIMNFIGTYVNGRASIEIGATDGENGASATVNWSSSAAENSVWTMSGTFDAETLQFEYHDCVKTDYVYNESGEVDSQEEVYTGGHGFMIFSEGTPLTLTWQDDQENIAEGSVFEYMEAIPEEGEEAGTGLANPWSTADSIEAAAEGAGVGVSTFEDGMEISLGPVNVEEYRYMDGLLEIYAPVAAVDLTIRKGRADVAADGDISGDYNEYANTWTQNIKGLEVTCFGNREGESTKTIWQLDDTCFSITAYGAGGDDDFGLSPDDISSLINGLQ